MSSWTDALFEDTDEVGGLRVVGKLPLQAAETAQHVENSSRTAGVARRIRRFPTLPASKVAREEIQWLWEGRIPLAKVTVLEGDPGLGKSTLALDLAARVSAGGVMPDRTPTQILGDALVLSAEDGAGDTIRPRLEAAGADLDRVHISLAAKDGSMFAIPDDLDWLREEIERSSCRIVVIDPLTSYLSSSLNANSDQDVRAALGPLGNVANETRTAIVLVRHLRKAAADHAIHRGGGSVAIGAAARSVLLVERDPQHADLQVLAPVKTNVGRMAESLSYRLVDTDLGVARVEWLSTPSRHTAESLLAPPDYRAGKAFYDRRAYQLREIVEQNDRISVEEAFKLLGEAGMDTSFAFRSDGKLKSGGTIDRLKKRAGVRSVKVGFEDGWRLTLDRADSSDTTDEGA